MHSKMWGRMGHGPLVSGACILVGQDYQNFPFKYRFIVLFIWAIYSLYCRSLINYMKHINVGTTLSACTLDPASSKMLAKPC
jgi:hypothetical protein